MLRSLSAKSSICVDHMDVTMTFAMIALHESRYKVGPLREAWDAWRENLSDREASAALDRELDAMAEAVKLRRKK